LALYIASGEKTQRHKNPKGIHGVLMTPVTTLFAFVGSLFTTFQKVILDVPGKKKKKRKKKRTHENSKTCENF